MKTSLLMNFSVDKENNKINVEREFAAPITKVWAAWTESEILDQWWAPKPWKARTKSMDFSEGGQWLYAMVGPEGEEHWCQANYITIAPQHSFSYKDAFCDENGVPNNAAPSMHWTNQFNEATDNTKVSIEIKFNTLADLEAIIKMGFKEGFTMGMENLDELLKTSR